MATRSRKEENKYTRHRKRKKLSSKCPFCNIPEHEVVRETKSFKIVIVLLKYSSWDRQPVESHLMVIPKKHTDKIGELTKSEAVEFIDIIGSYESQGYNTYFRAPATKTKTIAHHHTHLIKPEDAEHKFIFYIKKPYMRFLSNE